MLNRSRSDRTTIADLERRLAGSEARHGRLIESWAQALWETDARGVVVADSPSWRAYTGQTLEEWLGYGWLDAIHPDDRDYAERQWREAVAARGLVDAEFRLRAPDGGWRWTNVRAAPVLDETGQIEKWAGINIDIDARKRAEAALNESEAQYRLLFDSIDDGFCVIEVLFDKDDKPFDYKFVKVNPAFERQTGLGDPIGRTILSMVPEQEPFWFEIYGRIVRTGQSEQFDHRADALGRWYEVAATPIGEPGANQVAVVFRDVLHKRKAEEALRESEDRYRSLFESMDQGYAECELIRDPDGRATDVRHVELNPAFERLSGIPVAEARGRTVRELYPGFENWWVETYDRIVRAGRPERFEYEVAALGRWYEAHVHPQSGNRFTVLYEDITQRKRAEIALRESEQRQAFLLKLSDALRAEVDADAVANRAIRMLFEQMRLDRCYITLYRPAEDEADFPYQVGNDTVPALPPKVRLSDFPDAYEQVCEKTYVVDDDFERRGLSQAERANSEALGMRAMLASTIRKGEKTPLSSMVAVSSRPRRWSAAEIALVEETAERTWAAVERTRAEAALRESEERLHLALEATDLASYEWDLVSDRLITDDRFRDLVGIAPGEPVIGAKVMEHCVHLGDRARVDPDLARAMDSGGDGKFVFDHRLSRIGPLGHPWVLSHGQVYFGGPDEARLPVRIFGTLQDITDRKHAEIALRESEERQAFLLELSDAVRPVADPADIQGETTRLLREQLNAGWCYYVDWDLDRKIGLVLRDSTGEGLPSLAGAHDVSDAPEFLQLLAVGEMLTVRDYVGYEQLPTRIRQKFVALGFRSMMAAPLVKEGRLIASLLVGDTKIRDWTASEASLLVEVAERTWAAVERVRAEAALRESEKKYRVLFDSIDEGLTVTELVRDAEGRPIDLIYREFNLAFERQSGLPTSVMNKRVTEVLPQFNPDWFVQYARIAETGVPERSEEYLPDLDRWNRRFMSRIGGPGSPFCAVVFEDITERKRAEIALRESEERQRLTIELVPALLWSASPDGQEISLNEGWMTYTGQSELDTQNYGWRNAIHPDDLPGAQAAAEHAFATGEPLERQHRIRKKNDGWRWHLVRHVPVRDDGGVITRWFGAAIDVHEQHELQERQQVLVGELQHRTRNLMGIVRSVSDATMRASTDLEDFEGKFRDRLAALARVQGLLSRLAETDRITFDELLRTELTAHGALGREERRVTLKGPIDVPLRSSTVQTLALALHELSTNAIKYGAPGTPRGRLAVVWRLEPSCDGAGPLLHIDWRESGVDMGAADVSRPLGSGQGRELIERALPYQLKAQTTFVLEDDGLHCTIVLPVSERGSPRVH